MMTDYYYYNNNDDKAVLLFVYVGGDDDDAMIDVDHHPFLGERPRSSERAP